MRVFFSPTILYLNKKHVFWICIKILCTPFLHFTVVSHIAELIVLGIKIISFCWSEHLASQKMWKKYSAIELVTNACFVFLANSAKPKVFQGFILPLNGRTNSSEENYILHITVKNYVYFILVLHQKYCDKTVFSLQSLFAKIALKMLLIFLSEDSLISSMFSRSLSFFLPAVRIFVKQLQYESFMTVLQSSELY